MPPKSESLDLESLINNCIKDPHSPEWNRAWETLINRYKAYVYTVIFRRCYDQNIKDYGYNQRYIADDIFSMFLVKLCKNQGRILRSIKIKNNEKAFKAFLATIANRTALKYLKQLKLKSIQPDIEDTEKEHTHIDIEWEVYQDLVEILRQGAGPQDYNIERDILLFNLVKLEDFEDDNLPRHPFFRKLGHRVRDNVVSRFRKRLEKSLRELR